MLGTQHISNGQNVFITRARDSVIELDTAYYCIACCRLLPLQKTSGDGLVSLLDSRWQTWMSMKREIAKQLALSSLSFAGGLEEKIRKSNS